MTNWAVNVRKIVLNVVVGNPEAAQAYLHEPAMRHGVEVTIGVLSRAAEVLLEDQWYDVEETARLIERIAVECSRSGGQEIEQVIAAANSDLFPATQPRAPGGELDDMRALFDLQQTRMAKATQRWRAQDPATRAHVLPDLGELLDWLMDAVDGKAS